MYGTDKIAQLIAEEITHLPEGFHYSLSRGFLALVAALQLHGFAVRRADEAKPLIGEGDDLWREMRAPAIWIYNQQTTELSKKLQANIKQHSMPQYTKDSNHVIRTNLSEQYRLLALLEKFYTGHQPISFHSKLIVETIGDQGESSLKPQGGDVRIIQDEAVQKGWDKMFRAEMLEFGEFLMKELEQLR